MSSDTVLISPVYFISDLHLGVGSAEAERVKRRRFVELTNTVQQGRGSLVIVGDLFDFWYEYRYVVPRGSHEVLTALGQLTEAKCPVVYLAGNHDFAIGSVFSDDLGVTVVRDDLHFSSDGKRFYVFHGDGLAPKDGGYRLLKKLLRARWAQIAFRVLHPDLGFAIARRFSHGSRDYTSGKFYGETDGMRLEAQNRIAAGADYVVMGHRHLPAFERIGNGAYINLGDWLRHFSYAVFEHGDISLRTLENDMPITETAAS
ncbi:MAG: UDP-2,3-diacylglucosamine diphosphatase [Bacteroidia bacterium]|nr:UDP-2,3-diacylglucosamine diphosphatase [Bacteroidia bacterium]